MKMKSLILLAAGFLMGGQLFAQDCYYIAGTGDRVECTIKSWSNEGIKVDDGTKKGKLVKAGEVTLVKCGEDSLVNITGTSLPMAPKNFLAKVLATGKIEYYVYHFQKSDGDIITNYLLKKGDVYESIDSFNKKWKDLFKDNSSIYNQVSTLKPKEYYYSNEALLELILQYNAEEQ